MKDIFHDVDKFSQTKYSVNCQIKYSVLYLYLSKYYMYPEHIESIFLLIILKLTIQYQRYISSFNQIYMHASCIHLFNCERSEVSVSERAEQALPD